MKATDITDANKALKAFKTLNDLDILTPDQQRSVYESIKLKFGDILPYGINYPKPPTPIYERK